MHYVYKAVVYEHREVNGKFPFLENCGKERGQTLLERGQTLLDNPLLPHEPCSMEGIINQPLIFCRNKEDSTDLFRVVSRPHGGY
jgi:hypothetical protein